MNPLRQPLEQLLHALAPLNIMGKPIASLDTTLGQRVTEAVQALNVAPETVPPLDDAAACIGCGTYPKGYYTCATCVASEEHEGEQEHVSDWPVSCR